MTGGNSEDRIIARLQMLKAVGKLAKSEAYFDGLCHGMGLVQAYELKAKALAQVKQLSMKGAEIK